MKKINRMDFELFKEQKLIPLFDKAVQENIFSKAVVGFLIPSANEQTGFTTALFSKNVSANAVFDLASLTKCCPTSTIALEFVQKGLLDLNAPIMDYLPEFNTNYKEFALVRHLLTHSLDYRVPMSSLKHLPATEILNHLMTYQFAQKPGTVFNYGNPASILLGLILQRLSGKNLNELAEEILLTPLRMTRSGFYPLQKVAREEIVPTEICPFRGRTICGEVHDESAFVLGQLFPVGSAGMFSCVPDLLSFLKTLLNDGVFEGKRILAPGILNLISTNALSESVPHAVTALGFELQATRFMGTQISNRAFGKTGFTGTSFIGDPILKAGFVLLTNFTYPKRETSADRINQFRAQLADLFFGTLRFMS